MTVDELITKLMQHSGELPVVDLNNSDLVSVEFDPGDEDGPAEEPCVVLEFDD
jgi:hypothetical protein